MDSRALYISGESHIREHKNRTTFQLTVQTDDETHSGPLAVEIGRMALQLDKPYLRPQAWLAMLATIDDFSELRALHLSQLADDCNLSKAILEKLQGMSEEEVQVTLGTLSGAAAPLRLHTLSAVAHS